MALDRDRMYFVTLVLTVAAIVAFGVFAVRDYQENKSPSSVVLKQTGGSAGPALAQEAPLATPGAGGAAQGGSVTSSLGGSGGGAGATVGRAAAGSAPAVNASVQGCVGGVINIGQIVPITGPVTEQTAANAVVAYFKRVNSSGGINGCQVNFTYLDDGGLNQQQAAADARQLVQEDHVFAIVGNVEPVTTASTEPYFRQQGVPLVGVDGVGINEYGSPVEYSFAESPPGFGISTADYANSKGCKRIAAFYLDFDFGHASFEAMQQQAAKNGQTIVYSNSENVGSQSYGADTVQARNANPDCVINIMDPNSVVREFNAMNSNAWYPEIVATTSTSDPVVNQSEAAWLSNPAHVIYAQRNYEPANANVPEVQDWVQTEGQYFPGFDPNSYAEGAWLGAKTFTEMARRLGGNLTRGNLFNALNNLQNYHTGFTPDITMSNQSQNRGPNQQLIWMKWDAGSKQYQAITGWQPW